MKTLSCTCRNCGSPVEIDVEDQDVLSESFLTGMATCDRCYETRERIEKSNREKYNRLVDRETKWKRKPYND